MLLLCFKCIAQIEEKIDQQRAHAMSTLDRLARQVAVEKLERFEKCKAFKVRLFSVLIELHSCIYRHSRLKKLFIQKWTFAKNVFLHGSRFGEMHQSQQWMLCSEWVPSEWDSDKNITIIPSPSANIWKSQELHVCKKLIQHSGVLILICRF